MTETKIIDTKHEIGHILNIHTIMKYHVRKWPTYQCWYVRLIKSICILCMIYIIHIMYDIYNTYYV